ncbi:sensor histidine kinase [Sulfuriflexus sp.]|uniref:sensor histidine kinase n=1 Tax=Sulfuriflexus sp. TaxID=2015443 RepID=UPI0028CD3CC0|nr:ATP-binding protein [Sulfuriflexus sp.]MDT8403649.1 ATP-binding protein [Sulfuriflexus sp.]
MPTKFLKRLTSGPLSAALLSVLLLLSLYLMSGATNDSATFNRHYDILLITNIIGLTMLVVMIGANSYRLYLRYKRNAPGSRLTTRLLGMFILIAVVPVSIVYYFSVEFLHRGIDNWFDVRIEQALEDSLELSRSSLDNRMRDLLRQMDSMSVELADVSVDTAALALDDLVNRSGAHEMTLFAGSRIIASSSGSNTLIINPNRPDESILSYIREGRHYVGLTPIGDKGLYIRVVIRVPVTTPGFDVRAVQALFPVAERQSELADSVQQAFSEYKELVFLRQPLKFSFILTLSLVLLLSILSAVWAAFFSARRMVEPISDLAEGTRAVAAGDYSKRLPLSGNDELGFLVQSFNQMTRRIERARNDAQQSRQQAEEQRAYMEGVLAHLSSGVLTLDREYTLRTVNQAAAQILGVELEPELGQPFTQLAVKQPTIRHFVEAIAPHLDHAEEWREEIILFGRGGRQVVMCRGVRLPATEAHAGDILIVFEDVTTLVQAQRDAAWGEVARRLAHEIKNPLTPIQLSAERLRHKYLKTMDKESAELLDRSTHTIVQQVEAMKAMVDAFSEYARAPQMKLEPLNLNALVNEVLDLYRHEAAQLDIDVSFDTAVPQVEADVGRLRQLLHNLIKNALEAMESMPKPCVHVSTRCMEESNCRFVELRVRDEGPGLPTDLQNELFEPYVTSKTKGTGLGLAIVKKIVEEHGGMVWAENSQQGGACIVIRLPVLHSGLVQASHGGTGRPEMR